MQKWEYRMLSLSSDTWKWLDTGKTTKQQGEFERLTELGKQGWELVEVLSTTGRVGQTIQIDYYFKRPIE